ncbi:MAG: hypothetical protein ACYDCW_05850 [Acidithiobacillus ferrivorans]
MGAHDAPEYAPEHIVVLSADAEGVEAFVVDNQCKVIAVELPGDLPETP